MPDFRIQGNVIMQTLTSIGESEAPDIKAGPRLRDVHMYARLQGRVRWKFSAISGAPSDAMAHMHKI